MDAFGKGGSRLKLPPSPLSMGRLALAVSLLFIVLIGAAAVLTIQGGIAVDFLSYWAAARMALTGNAHGAYDIAAHHAAQQAAVAFGGLLPFPYPPPFLLLLLPFGLLPYGTANALWVGVTMLLFFWATRGIIAPNFRLAHPAALATGLIGQNGFLTSGIFALGFGLLDRRPFAAGAVLGLFVVKPQLALLFPVAVVAARLWRTLLGAILSTALLVASAWLAFGNEAYVGFLSTAPRYATFLQQDRWPWVELASVFACLRWFGVPQGPALALHGAVALIAAALVWRAWRSRRDEAVAILAAATLLVPPYVFTYDALLLSVPMAVLLQNGRNLAWVSVIWLLCFLPVASHFGVYHGPNTIAAASILCLVLLTHSGGTRGAQVRITES